MKSQIKAGAILGYITMVANILITLLYVPLMLKLMGDSEYGLYSLVASIMAYFSVLDMGFGNAMIRFISKYKAQNNEEKITKINGMFLFLYIIIGIISLIIGFLLFINIKSIFPALSASELASAKIIMLVLLVTLALSFPLSIFDSYIMACEKFILLKVLNLIKIIATPLIMLPLLFWGYKSIAMVLVTCGLTLLYHFCTMYACFKKEKMHISFSIKNVDKTMFKMIFSYSFFIFLGLIVDTIFNNTDQVILGSVCGTTAVAIYAVAQKITSMNTNFSTTISGLFLPKITKVLEEKDGDKKASDIFIKVSRIQLYLMMLILTGVIVFGRQFITYWVGPDKIDAYYIILIIIGPSIIPLTQNIGLSIIQAKNIHQFRAIMYIFIAILNVCISIPLARLYQGVGAAIGTAIANLLGQIIIMNIFYWKKAKIDIPMYWKFFLKFILLNLPISILFVYIANIFVKGWLTLGLFAILYSIIYFIVCYIYMNSEEKDYVNKLINKVFKTLKLRKEFGK